MSNFIESIKIVFNSVCHATLVPPETRGPTITIEDGLKLNPVALSDKNPMPNPDRHAWVEMNAADLRQRFMAKYAKGQAEHGKDLGHVSVKALLDEMESEALDQLAYVRELKRRLM